MYTSEGVGACERERETQKTEIDKQKQSVGVIARARKHVNNSFQLLIVLKIISFKLINSSSELLTSSIVHGYCYSDIFFFLSTGEIREKMNSLGLIWI